MAPKSRLGWHQDTVHGLSIEDHSKLNSPVVSFSFGDTGIFKYKNKMEDQPNSIQLISGSAICFGGPSRMIWHSITKIEKNSSPRELQMGIPGRFSLTFREQGHPTLWEEDGIPPVVPVVNI